MFGLVAAGIGLLFVALVGGAIVLAFAGFRGADARHSFGLYVGLVAAALGLVAVVGLVTSALVLAAGATGRDRPARIDDGGGTFAPEPRGPGMQPGVGQPGGMRRGPGPTTATPSPGNAAPSAPGQTLSLQAGDEARPGQTRGERGQMRDGWGRWGGGGMMGGRGAVWFGAGGILASLALGALAVLLFFWSLDLTGRRPWGRKAPRDAGSQPVDSTESESADPRTTQRLETP